MKDIIAGRKPVLEALKAGSQIEKILFLLHTRGRAINEIRSLATQRGIAFEDANREKFRGVAGDIMTQGVVAVVSSKQFLRLEDLLEIPKVKNEKGLLLVLDEIEDPHNLGALIRTGECAGVHGVIIARHHAATVTPTVVKASAGATEHMAMAEVTNIAHSLKLLKEAGYWVVGLDMQGDRDFTAIDYTSATAIVVGNEGRGIRRLVLERCDYRARIPLAGKIDSLNASVAGALVMYEALQQRKRS